MHHEGEAVLEQVLAAAGIERATLVGHSDGGSIAIVYEGSRTQSARTKSRADRLVLIAAHVFNEPLSRESIEDAGRLYRDTDLREKLARHHGENVDCAFWGWHDAWLSDEFRTWNLEEYLSSISVPTLIVQGEDDNFGTIAQVEVIAAGVSGPVETVMLPDCAHSPHREQPKALLETIVHSVA